MRCPSSNAELLCQTTDRCYDFDNTFVVVEVKKRTHSSQAIGTVVLSSFVENKLHPLLTWYHAC